MLIFVKNFYVLFFFFFFAILNPLTFVGEKKRTKSNLHLRIPSFFTQNICQIF